MKGWKKIKTWLTGNHVPIKEEVNMEYIDTDSYTYGQSLRHMELLEEQMMAQAQAQAYVEEVAERRLNWREAMREGFPRDAEERAGWRPEPEYDVRLREGEEIPMARPRNEPSEHTTIHEMLEERDRERQHQRFEQAGRAYRERMMREDRTAQTTEPILRRPNHPTIDETRSAVWEIKRERIDIPEGIFSTKRHECKYYGFCGEKTDTVQHSSSRLSRRIYMQKMFRNKK